MYTKVHLIQTTHQKGGRRRGGILIFRLQKFGEKRQFSFSFLILILIRARAKPFNLSTELHPCWIRGPEGRLIQFTKVHELQDFSDHFYIANHEFRVCWKWIQHRKRSRRLAAPWALWDGYLCCMLYSLRFASFMNPIQ